MTDCIIFCQIAAGDAAGAVALETERLGWSLPIMRRSARGTCRSCRASTRGVRRSAAGSCGRDRRAGAEDREGAKRLYGVQRVGFVFTGNDVPHVHAHLIPLHLATDVTSLRYFNGVDLHPTGAARIGPEAQACAARALAEGMADALP